MNIAPSTWHVRESERSGFYVQITALHSADGGGYTNAFQIVPGGTCDLAERVEWESPERAKKEAIAFFRSMADRIERGEQ